MLTHTISTLEASSIVVSGGKSLSGGSAGGGSHLLGETITIEAKDWVAVDLHDTGDLYFEDNDTCQTLASDITYDGTDYDAGLVVEAEYKVIVQDSDGNFYTLLGFNINEDDGDDDDGNNHGTVEGLAFVGDSGDIPPMGEPLTVISAEDFPKVEYKNIADPQCFTKGCEIRTPDGQKRIEDLRVGDTVLTKDNGPQIIRWIGRRKFSARQLAQNTKFRPIRIMQGALGGGLPERDMLVSRQHRMLIHSKIANRMFDEPEVLVPAIKLTDLPGIFIDEQVESVEYFHLLFDQHEIIFAEGAPTESLLTGPEALKGLTPEARTEILSIFPEVAGLTQRPESARLIPSGRQQKQLVYRHRKNNRPCLEAIY